MITSHEEAIEQQTFLQYLQLWMERLSQLFMVSHFQQNETTTQAPLIPVQLVYQAIYSFQALFKLYN